MNRSLDGMRAFAIIAVLFFHCGAPWFDAGWIGVDLFFVLSGFLITTLLQDEHRRFGYINLRLFWVRRFLRLMPAYVFYVSGITLAMLIGPTANLSSQGGWTPIAYIMSLWTYLSNYAPQGGIWMYQDLTRHLWSLSVEEQFYFIWPVALLLLVRMRHFAILSWVFIGVIVFRNIFAYGLYPPKLLLHTRGIGLAIGATVAITLYRHGESLTRMRILSATGTWIALVALILSLIWLTYGAYFGMRESELLRMRVPIFDLAAGFLVANIWHEPKSMPGKILSCWPLPQIGAISYGIYLYHMLIWEVTWHHLLVGIGGWPSVTKFGLRLFVFIILTLAISVISYMLLERPFLRFKDRFRPG